MTDDYYKNKNILVTGGDGFIGSHLVEKLIHAAANTYVISQFETLVNLDAASDAVREIFVGDITNKNNLTAIQKRLGKVDVVFHLAADLSVTESITNPEKVRKTNVVGTENMLAMAVQLGAKRFVYTSTSTVYGWSVQPVCEDMPPSPRTPYAMTKLAGEKLCKTYANRYGLEITIPRLFNAYGERQRNDVLPSFIKKALHNEDIPLEGEGKQKRDFLHVDDITNALLIMGSHPLAKNEIINFGTGKNIKISAVAEKIIKMSGSSSNLVHVAPRKNDGSSVCDYAKAKLLLGWTPKIGLDRGLRRTIAWAKTDPHFKG
ncbi:MAG: NAD-dependent epimerase/dehydratase family protein [archaeon]